MILNFKVSYSFIIFASQVLHLDQSPNSRRWSRLGWILLVWISLMAPMRYVQHTMCVPSLTNQHFLVFHWLCLCLSVPRCDHQKCQRGGGDHDLGPFVLSISGHRFGYEGSRDPHRISERGEYVELSNSIINKVRGRGAYNIFSRKHNSCGRVLLCIFITILLFGSQCCCRPPSALLSQYLWAVGILFMPWLACKMLCMTCDLHTEPCFLRLYLEDRTVPLTLFSALYDCIFLVPLCLLSVLLSYCLFIVCIISHIIFTV